MEDDNVDHDGVKGEEDYDVENNNVEEEEGDDDVEEEDRSQDRDPQFVRACAVEMHMDISGRCVFLSTTRKLQDVA